MTEYIILTKPAEKMTENTIVLSNKVLTQVGLKKDTETLESYLSHLDWAEHFEKYGGRPLMKHLYFVDGAIRIRWHTADHPHKYLPLKPYTNTQGCMHSLPKAANILYHFDKKLKEILPEPEYQLKIKHIACCRLQPRIAFKKADLKKINKTFPEFHATEDLDTEDFEPSIIPAGLKYDEDYSEHDGYYDCPRCDPDPCWGRYREEKPEEDPTEEFYEQKTPKRNKGSPRAFCFGTRKKDLPAGKRTIELGYWKLSSEELLSRINNPKQDDVSEALVDERRMRVLTGKIKISLTDQPMHFDCLAEILAANQGCYAQLMELEEKGLIKEYHANKNKLE